MLQDSRSYMTTMYQNRIKQFQVQMKQMQDSVSRLRIHYNVLSDEPQTEMLVEQLLKAQSGLVSEKARLTEYQKHYDAKDTIVINTAARIKGYEQQLRTLTSNSSGSSINLERYREGLDKIDALENHIYLVTEQMSEVQNAYYQVAAYSDQNFSAVSQVQKAMASDRKAKPVRWIIMLTSFLLCGFAAIATALLIEGIRLNNAKA